MLKRDIIPYIDQIRERKITNRDLARKLGVNEAYLCRQLKALGIVREPSPFNPEHRDQLRKLAETRRQARLHMAQTMSAKAAAQAAGVSLSTIYRLRNK